jgi:hypothetical protein
VHYDNPLEGDLHWIVPGKLIAFKGPRSLPNDALYTDHDGVRTFSPKFYLEPFSELGVGTVIRLNEQEYPPEELEAGGVRCIDLEFDDCSAPPVHIAVEFLHAVEHASAPVAVHCKAGLGRTGTLIALYMMKHHGFSAREAMGWLRIVRPGSVIGEQQDFLCGGDPPQRVAGGGEVGGKPGKEAEQLVRVGDDALPSRRAEQVRHRARSRIVSGFAPLAALGSARHRGSCRHLPVD